MGDYLTQYMDLSGAWASIWKAVTTLIDADLAVKSLAFGMVAGGLSAALLLFDGLVVAVRGRGVLGVTHGWRTFWMVPVWFVGGCMAGGFGALFRMYEFTLQAAILAAFTWRTFLTQAQTIIQRQQEDRQT